MHRRTYAPTFAITCCCQVESTLPFLYTGIWVSTVQRVPQRAGLAQGCSHTHAPTHAPTHPPTNARTLAVLTICCTESLGGILRFHAYKTRSAIKKIPAPSVLVYPRLRGGLG